MEKVNLIDFEVESNIFLMLGYLKLLLGYPSTCMLLQYFDCAIKGNLVDFEIEQKSFLY